MVHSHKKVRGKIELPYKYTFLNPRVCNKESKDKWIYLNYWLNKYLGSHNAHTFYFYDKNLEGTIQYFGIGKLIIVGKYFGPRCFKIKLITLKEYSEKINSSLQKLKNVSQR